MKLYPPYISGKCKSNAEKKVFAQLKQSELGKEWFAVHSLNVSEHVYKQWSELDFVVVGPPGVFIFEVKGGRISRKDKLWTYTDRYGEKHTSSEGPFDQAKSGMESLIERMKADSLTHPLMRAMLVGRGVIFPDIPFDIRGPDMPSEIICDRQYFSGRKNIDVFIQELAQYWRKKLPGKTDLRGSSLNAIKHFIATDFDLVPPLGALAGEVEEKLVSLSNEQYRTLEAIEEEPRIVCHGGAGTGKTFLALETARREAAIFDRTILVTFPNRFMSAYVSNQIDDSRIRVTDVETLLKRLSNRSEVLFDELIVDEGQDILNFDMLDQLGPVLKGGLEGGRWRWFMDHNNQSHITSGFDKDAAEYLNGLATAHPRLKRNCRNTEQIIDLTQQSTGADIGITQVKGIGPPVTQIKIANIKDEANLLEDQLRKWREDDVPGHDIAILTAGSVNNSAAQHMSARMRQHVENFDVKIAAERPWNKITLSSIEDFKGLERHFIALIDLDRLKDDERSQGLLYVGMTRPHSGLWMAVGDVFGELLRQWQKAVLPQLLKERLNEG